MEISLIIRRQYGLVLEEEEARFLRLLLDGLDASDLEPAIKRRDIKPGDVTKIRKVLADLKEKIVTEVKLHSD